MVVVSFAKRAWFWRRVSAVQRSLCDGQRVSSVPAAGIVLTSFPVGRLAGRAA
ncbi:MAG: hypothetical protein ACK5ZG_14680 [Phycisphaerae bacterium]